MDLRHLPQAARGTGGDSSANVTAAADHGLTTLSGVYHNAAEAEHSENGYWLTKRRDGRSGNWMIARYQPRNRSIVYRSCKTGDIEVARKRLALFAQNNPASPSPPSARPSDMVYFIRAETGRIKIGIARDVAKRLSELRTMSPVALELAAVIAGGQALEADYHRRFAEHRSHGEWFNRHADILAEIERIRGGS